MVIEAAVADVGRMVEQQPDANQRVSCAVRAFLAGSMPGVGAQQAVPCHFALLLCGGATAEKISHNISKATVDQLVHELSPVCSILLTVWS